MRTILRFSTLPSPRGAILANTGGNSPFQNLLDQNIISNLATLKNLVVFSIHTHTRICVYLKPITELLSQIHRAAPQIQDTSVK